MPSNLPPQTYFRKRPASTNSLSKKASQNLRGRRCSPQALAIRRPPACLGCKSVFRTQGQIRPNLALDWPTRIRRGCLLTCTSHRFSGPRCLKMPIFADFCRCCRLPFYPRSPKTAQDASKTPPRCPKTPPRPPKSRPRAPKSPPRRPGTSKMEPSWGQHRS